jgi:hypothetical protein
MGDLLLLTNKRKDVTADSRALFFLVEAVVEG